MKRTMVAVITVAVLGFLALELYGANFVVKPGKAVVGMPERSASQLKAQRPKIDTALIKQTPQANLLLSLVRDEMQRWNPDREIGEIEAQFLFVRSNALFNELLLYDKTGQAGLPYYANMIAFNKKLYDKDWNAAMAALEPVIKDFSTEELEKLAYLIVLGEDIKDWILVDKLPRKEFLDLMKAPMHPDTLVGHIAEEIALSGNKEFKEMLSFVKGAGRVGVSGGGVTAGLGGGAASSMASCFSKVSGSSKSAFSTPGGGVTDPVSHGDGLNGGYIDPVVDPTLEQWERAFGKSNGWDQSGGYGGVFGKCGAPVDPDKVKGGYVGEGPSDVPEDIILVHKEVQDAKKDMEDKKEYLDAVREDGWGMCNGPENCQAYFANEESNAWADLQIAIGRYHQARANAASKFRSLMSGEFRPLQDDGFGGCSDLLSMGACLGWGSGGSMPEDCSKSKAADSRVATSNPDSNLGCGSGTGFPVILNEYVKDPPQYDIRRHDTREQGVRIKAGSAPLFRGVTPKLKQ